MDNVNIHHCRDTETMILESGNALLFNATYSSPLNPIENMFSIWKRRCEVCPYQNREEIHMQVLNGVDI